ncbi:MAG: hypothetical protein WCW13_02605 [archaeon]|jgi:hypothetical protein
MQSKFSFLVILLVIFFSGFCFAIQTMANSISGFDGFYDGNVSVSFKCASIAIDSNVTLFDSKTNIQLATLTKQTCSDAESVLVFQGVNLPFGGIVKAVLEINQPCEVCSREVFVPITKTERANPIPDNNLFFMLLTLIAVLFFVTNQKKN